MKKFITGCLLFFLFTSLVLAQGNYEKPRLEQKDSWSLIMVPDIQNYVKWGRNQPLLDLITAWIEDNIDTLNVKMVVCVGDLVHNNEKINRDYDGDQTTQRQWEAVSKAFARLDHKVPYIAATGNHDYSVDRQGKRSSRYSEFFSIDRNYLNQKYLVQNTRVERSSWQGLFIHES